MAKAVGFFCARRTLASQNPMNPDLQALIYFALRTLEILADDEEWSADTTDSIFHTAVAEGLLDNSGPDGLCALTNKALNLGTRYKAP